MHENSQTHKRVEKMHRKELQNERKKIRMLVGEGGMGRLHWQRGPDKSDQVR